MAPKRHKLAKAIFLAAFVIMAGLFVADPQIIQYFGPDNGDDTSCQLMPKTNNLMGCLPAESGARVTPLRFYVFEAASGAVILSGIYLGYSWLRRRRS